MQLVTADAINSRSKQKSSQLQTNPSRKFQKNKRKEKRIIVKNANRHSIHQIQSKNVNIGETVTKLLKKNNSSIK